jgi:hypothetical protein
MNNLTLQIKVKERLNKGDSSDYPDLPCWVIAEAFNKEQSSWVREQLQGLNSTLTGAGGSIRRIDDLQVLLNIVPVTMSNQGIFWETTGTGLPTDYMQFSRLSAGAVQPCCPPRPLKIYLKPISDVDILLSSNTERPDYEWAETFACIVGNNIRIYTNNSFTLDEPYLVYYRQPRLVQFSNCVDPYTGLPVSTDVESELPDDVVEIIIDRAAMLLAGDIENQFQVARNQQNAQIST